MASSERLSEKTSALEWIAGAVGVVLLILMIAIVGHDALTRSPEAPAAIAVTPGKVTRTAGGYVVTFTATNKGGGDAAELQIEGQLVAGSGEIETSSATVDYVPGNGATDGGLFFVKDPTQGRLKLRPLGYQAP